MPESTALPYVTLSGKGTAAAGEWLRRKLIGKMATFIPPTLDERLKPLTRETLSLYRLRALVVCGPWFAAGVRHLRNYFISKHMQNESDKVKTRIRLVIRRLYRDEPCISFGWDWPTLCIVKPWVAAELKGLFEDLRALKSAGL